MSENAGTSGDFRSSLSNREKKWSALLPKITWIVLVVGVVLGAIFWFTISGETGNDLGALTWTLTFAASVALMSLRQIILAERK
jgi:Mg/Co/Ni transporter MgtE